MRFFFFVFCLHASFSFCSCYVGCLAGSKMQPLSSLTATATTTVMATEETATSTCSTSASPGNPHHVSLLSSLCKQEPSRPLHVLVQGPSHSGRSSLAMDIAMEMASKMPCQCQPLPNTGSRICHCQPVALLRFGRRDPTQEDHVHRFPLACHRVRRQRQQQQQQDQSIHPSAATTTNTSTSTWTKQSLRRIQVHHAVNLQSCLQFLLALQGKPHHQQPFGALVMDDMDFLMDHQDHDEKDSPHRILSQVLALVMDTLYYLHSPPAVVCITLNNHHHSSPRATQVSPFSSYVASFWNAIVTLQQDTSKRALVWKRIGQENQASLCGGSWTATWIPRGLSQQHETPKSTSIAYAVVCNQDSGRFRILWEEEADGMLISS